MVHRWSAVLAGAAGLVGFSVAAFPGTATAATGGALCQLAGTANFTPGLNSSAAAFKYNFGGTLSGCQSNDSTAPASGTVEAGKTVTVSYPWTYTDATGVHSGTANATYQEPIPVGNGSCSNSTTSGTAISNWADGSVTVVDYTTTGALAAVNLSGSVAASVTDTLVSFTGPTQAPPAATHVVSTSRFAGNSSQGLLVFQPPDPTLCTTTGVVTAAISGQDGVGSAQ